MKIGILGGSFDPIHKGHLHMALQAYQQYHLQEVWLIPNGNAPHKDSRKMAAAAHRLAMCRLAEKQYSFLKTCDMEILSPEYSYTYLTMTKLHEQYPEHEFYFIMGADSLDYFEKWKQPQIIAACCKLLVVNRGEFSEADLQKKIKHLQQLFPADIAVIHCCKMDISSTEVRRQLKESDVLPEVYAYICLHGLYGNCL